MKIAIFSEDNLNVAKGVDELLSKYSEQSPEVIFPIVNGTYSELAQSIVNTCKVNGVRVTVYVEDFNSSVEDMGIRTDAIKICDDPVQEVLHQLNPGDAVGIAWVDSEDDHLVLHTIEDLALDIWDITDGIEPLSFDGDMFSSLSPDELREAVHKSTEVFVDTLAAYIAATVMESLGEAFLTQILRHNLSHRKPFDDQE